MLFRSVSQSRYDEVELKAKKKGESQYSYWGCWNVAETLNVVVNGFRYDFGVGGIHGSINNKIARSNKKYILVDADVSSYYPNMAISNNVSSKGIVFFLALSIRL